MVLIRLPSLRALLVAMALLIGLLGPAATASAHENHQQEQAERRKVVQTRASVTPGAMHEMMEAHAQAMEEARPRTFSQRLTSWIGRTHPFAVHFPIALFPVALVALALARRRGERVELIRALIIVAGASAAGAAALGWLTGGLPSTDPDSLHVWHRWIGTGLGSIGTGLAIWAWRRRSSVDSQFMIVALALVTLLLLVQGWLGAALVHGMEHMQF